MQKMADDTELKAAAERAAKERRLALGLHRSIAILSRGACSRETGAGLEL